MCGSRLNHTSVCWRLPNAKGLLQDGSNGQDSLVLAGLPDQLNAERQTFFGEANRHRYSREAQPVEHCRVIG